MQLRWLFQTLRAESEIIEEGMRLLVPDELRSFALFSLKPRQSFSASKFTKWYRRSATEKECFCMFIKKEETQNENGSNL